MFSDQTSGGQIHSLHGEKVGLARSEDRQSLPLPRSSPIFTLGAISAITLDHCTQEERGGKGSRCVIVCKEMRDGAESGSKLSETQFADFSNRMY